MKGELEWTFTTGYYDGPGAILARSRHARVDVYTRALVITPLSRRVVILRERIRSITREDQGWRVVARGSVTRIAIEEHGDVILATTAAIHHRLREWYELDNHG